MENFELRMLKFLLHLFPWCIIGDDIILSGQDLHILTELLRPAAPQWRTIGGSLGILDHDLNIIQHSPMLISEGVLGYFREMLIQWLKLAPPNHLWPTVKALALALRSSGHESLAVNLKALFLQRKGRVLEVYLQIGLKLIWNAKSRLDSYMITVLKCLG